MPKYDLSELINEAANIYLSSNHVKQIGSSGSIFIQTTTIFRKSNGLGIYVYRKRPGQSMITLPRGNVDINIWRPLRVAKKPTPTHKKGLQTKICKPLTIGFVLNCSEIFDLDGHNLGTVQRRHKRGHKKCTSLLFLHDMHKIITSFPTDSVGSAKIPKYSLEPQFVKKLLSFCLIWALPIIIETACILPLSKFPTFLNWHSIPGRQIPS